MRAVGRGGAWAAETVLLLTSNLTVSRSPHILFSPSPVISLKVAQRLRTPLHHAHSSDLAVPIVTHSLGPAYFEALGFTCFLRDFLHYGAITS